MNRLTLCMMAAIAGFLISCGNQSGSQTNASSSNGNNNNGGKATSTNVQVFQVLGTIKRLEPDEKRVVIRHEEIPDFMAAMTMPFSVKDAKDLQGLSPEDRVSFRLHYTEEDSWIDDIQKVTSPAAPSAERQAVRIVRDVEPLEVGDIVPDYPFTNQFGRAVSLGDFKGQALALTFIFTRCPMPDFCPLMSKRFVEALRILKETPNAPTNWHLVTVSFDPHFDTPAVLKGYAERQAYDPAKWSFVTGAMIEIDAITEQFSMMISKQGQSWDHKLRTVVLDPERRVRKIFVYNEWTAQDLVNELLSAAEGKAAPAAAQPPNSP